jgi:pimeloyl-ACP methyl ester carboxylesterase
MHDFLSARIPTRYVDLPGRRLAYREIGEGTPLILCLRLRGVMDVWDPAFLDALADTFRVIVFDYTGLGLSSGEPSYAPEALANDALELADALGLGSFALAGWSLGGQAAQALTVRQPERVSHLILIGTTPPGKVRKFSEPIFFQTALKFDNDLTDETILFFNPASEKSRAAAAATHDRIAQRTADISPAIPEATYMRLLKARTRPADELFHDTGNYAAFLGSTAIPILAISGDHDIVFPVENWFDLNRQWNSLHLIVIPEAGHGPQHQEPQFCAAVISSFCNGPR